MGKYKFQTGGDSTDFFNSLADMYQQQSQYQEDQNVLEGGEEQDVNEQENDSDYDDLQQRYDELQNQYDELQHNSKMDLSPNDNFNDSFLDFLFSEDEQQSRLPVDFSQAPTATSPPTAPGYDKGLQGYIKRGFRTYPSYEQGRKALENQLELYKSGRSKTGIKPTHTLLQAMSIYAPSSDSNNPTHYAQVIANSIGVSPNTPIEKIDTKKWADAIQQMEGNKYGNNPGNLRYQTGGEVPIFPSALFKNRPKTVPVNFYNSNIPQASDISNFGQKKYQVLKDIETAAIKKAQDRAKTYGSPYSNQAEVSKTPYQTDYQKKQAAETRRQKNEEFAATNSMYNVNRQGDLEASGLSRFYDKYGKNLDKFARSWETPLALEGVVSAIPAAYRLGAGAFRPLAVAAEDSRVFSRAPNFGGANETYGWQEAPSQAFGEHDLIPINKKTGVSMQEEYINNLQDYYNSPGFKQVMKQYPKVDIEKYKQITLDNLKPMLRYSTEPGDINASGFYTPKLAGNNIPHMFGKRSVPLEKRVSIAFANANDPEFKTAMSALSNSGEHPGISKVQHIEAVAHELNHQRTNASELLPDYLTKDYLQRNVRADIPLSVINKPGDNFMNYYSNPTEFEVRTRALKEDLKKAGIKDYHKTSDFTENDINKLINIEQTNDTYKNFLQVYKNWKEGKLSTPEYNAAKNKLYDNPPIDPVSSDSYNLLQYHTPSFLAENLRKLPAIIPPAAGAALLANQKKKKAFKWGGKYKFAGTVAEQQIGLNDGRYNEMDFPMEGMNTFRGLDNGRPVLLKDKFGRKTILHGAHQTANMYGNVYEKRI